MEPPHSGWWCWHFLSSPVRSLLSASAFPAPPTIRTDSSTHMATRECSQLANQAHKCTNIRLCRYVGTARVALRLNVKLTIKWWITSTQIYRWFFCVIIEPGLYRPSTSTIEKDSKEVLNSHNLSSYRIADRHVHEKNQEQPDLSPTSTSGIKAHE